MKYHIIAIDCDDVLVSTSPLIVSNYNKTYGTTLDLSDMYKVNLEHWGVTKDTEAIERVAKYMESDEYRSAPPFQDAITTIQELSKHYELHMVTGRTILLETVTKEMLAQYFPNLFTSLEFTGLFSDTPRTKSDVCTQLGADLLIDDHLGHALPVAACGVDVLLFGEYPWNQTTEPLPPNVQRAKDWNAVKKVLLT